MDPIAAAILGGSSILGGIFGASDNSANALNARAIQSQERENLLRRVMSERLLQIQLQGGTDAFGNTSRYVPGQGFVTTPSTQVKQLQDASIREELLRATQDAALRREGLQDNAARRREEGPIADTLRQRFTRQIEQPETSQDELFQLLLASGAGEFNRQQGSALQSVLRQNLRAGGSTDSGAAILARFAGDAASRRGDQAVDAKLRAITGAEDINNTALGNTGNLYNLFATRASNFEDVPFRPEQLSAGANALGAANRQGVIAAGQTAGSLVSTSGARPVVAPTDRAGNIGNAIAGGGSAVAGLLDFFRAQQQQPQAGTGRVNNIRLGNVGAIG